MISHWDDVASVRRERGHIAADWQSLTGERSSWVGLQRIRVEPGKWSTPLHLEASEEEIFYVLSGTGVSVQWDGSDEAAYAIGPERLSRPPRARARAHAPGRARTASRCSRSASGTTPRTRSCRAPESRGSGRRGCSRARPTITPGSGRPRSARPRSASSAERPGRIVNAADVERESRAGATVDREVRDLGGAADSLKTGLRLFDVRPGKLINPPHCHSAEEEIFVVLDGEGTLELWPHLRRGGEHEEHPVTRGSVVARPAGTGIAHTFRAGADGLSLLAYGTRDPRDVTYYPRSGKVNVRGLGLIGRLDVLDYWDGED